MPETEKWVLCPLPEIGDTLRWDEPLWAEPNKPRGKPDKIGEQRIIANLISLAEICELKVLNVEKTSPSDALIKVKEGDHIRRKKSTIERGDCYKKL
jgi:hypothetical protein